MIKLEKNVSKFEFIREIAGLIFQSTQIERTIEKISKEAVKKGYRFEPEDLNTTITTLELFEIIKTDNKKILITNKIKLLACTSERFNGFKENFG